MPRPLPCCITLEQAELHALRSSEFLELSRRMRARPRNAQRRETARQTLSLLRRAGEVATAALRFAETRTGYLNAAITLEGLLLVLVRSRAAELGIAGYAIVVVHRADPRVLYFATRKSGESFLQIATTYGIHAAGRGAGMDPEQLPAIQQELFDVLKHYAERPRR